MLSVFYKVSTTVFLRIRVFSFKNNPKNLDLSYKADLDLWDYMYLGRVKLIAKFHRTDEVICGHSREENTSSYSRISTVSIITCKTPSIIAESPRTKNLSFNQSFPF